ncbi:MAG: 50S ribosomal protein L13 [Deltaproteobacteria bacterium CG07_land_8_20_14_0_80_38_7]|nr:MAG: 50S ribosomal protein L13 [Deltaproteobacteria bacterium CG07_land_8_20_14_0_80_38_7]
MQKTLVAKPNEINREWIIVDLENKILGRAASKIANILRGKNKAIFTPHADAGSFVVAINASKVHLTGKKWEKKMYHKHSGFPCGLKSKTASKVRDTEPERLIRDAVWGMLPKNTLSRHQLKKLKIYPNSEHPHTSQKPIIVEL